MCIKTFPNFEKNFGAFVCKLRLPHEEIISNVNSLYSLSVIHLYSRITTLAVLGGTEAIKER